jgi:hypothetical protein
MYNATVYYMESGAGTVPWVLLSTSRVEKLKFILSFRLLAVQTPKENPKIMFQIGMMIMTTILE